MPTNGTAIHTLFHSTVSQPHRGLCGRSLNPPRIWPPTKNKRVPSLLTLPSSLARATTIHFARRLCSRARNSVCDGGSSDAPRLRAIFSDWMALVHFRGFEEHGSKIVSRDADAKRAICESPTGETRECDCCRLPPWATGSSRSAPLSCAATGRRGHPLCHCHRRYSKSTLMSGGRCCPPATCIAETGSRVYLQDGSLDADWVARFEHICGPLERELDVDSRPEPCGSSSGFGARRSQVSSATRARTTVARVDTKGDDTIDAALRGRCRAARSGLGNEPREVRLLSTGLGKGNVVAYLQEKFGVTPDECACSLTMTMTCRWRSAAAHLLPGLTSDSVARAAMEHPEWQVASRSGQGVFAIEECLEQLLERVRREKAAALAMSTTRLLPRSTDDQHAVVRTSFTLAKEHELEAERECE